MLKLNRSLVLAAIAWLFLLFLAPPHAPGQVGQTNIVKPFIAPASKDAEMAIKAFKAMPGLKVDLWAAEPMLANPVSFNFDEHGRVYVCETFRLHAGVDDIRGLMPWLDEELASRTVDDRLAEMKRHLGERFPGYSDHSERIRLLEDRAGTGKADHASVFADNFNSPLDGIAAGVLARKGSVWFASIPNLWLLRDTNADGIADVRQSLHYGFGVRVGFLGHDLHGLHFGPDGRIYFSIGDRGSNIRLAEGRMVGEPDTGCVFRCNPDGSELEVFAFGLRNPQDLVFDQFGNLFTGDNNSDSGDEARWVYVVEGGDSGWRVGYQFMENPYSRGPFNAEKLWHPHFDGQAAYIVPPIANIASGPSGVAYFPGTGLPDQFQDHFFLVDFRGGAANSGIHTFTLKPNGASFELVDPQHFIWSALATDVKFGVDGGLYFSDWVEGWEMTGKGRIYRVHDPAVDQDRSVLETKRLLAQGVENYSLKDLARLLSHRDMRVRQEAQFMLAERGLPALKTLASVARQSTPQLARLHAIWAVGQISRKSHGAGSEVEAGLEMLEHLLADNDAEVRAQSAKVLGEFPSFNSTSGLLKLLRDGNSRVRFFAALSLGKLSRREAFPAILEMLRENDNQDPYLRHAGVMALTGFGDVDSLVSAARDRSPAVRMGVLLAMRRLQRSEISMFLEDADPAIVLEAARAINDQPINGAMRDLAALSSSIIQKADESRSATSSSEPLLRRVLNANFHLGTLESAQALAAFASLSNATPKLRVEALDELSDWQHPSGRDRVVGLWRPVSAKRPLSAATEALQPTLSSLLRSSPDKVRIAASRAAGRLMITNATPILSDLVSNTNVSSAVRVEALKRLAELDPSRLENALAVAQADPDEDLRKAATPLFALVKSSNPAVRLEGILTSGTTGEQQASLAALGSLPGTEADEILSQWLERLRAGEVPKEIQLDLLEAASKRQADAVKQKLSDYNAAKSKDDPLAPYREVLFGGDATQGKKIFLERPDAQCVRCHKIDTEGGDVGPDLSHIGSQKDRQYLLESILLPNKQIAPGFDSVMVNTKGGDTYAGVLKSETDKELVLNSPDGGKVTVQKSDIESRRKALSPMPEGIGQILSKQDLRDLVEFLSGRK